MLYTLQNENVNINYLAKLDFLDLCLLGETGTSKTRTAKLIHSLSPRKNAPFIAVNCAGLAGSPRVRLLISCRVIGWNCLERIEQDLLRNALAINNNNQTRAAQQLGISRSGLIKKLKRIAR